MPRVTRSLISSVLIAGILSGCGRTESDWKDAKQSNTVTAYGQFLTKHPHGPHETEAAEAIERIDWSKAKSTNSPSGYLAFFQDHPDSLRVSFGRSLVGSQTFIATDATEGMVGGSAGLGADVTLDGVKVPARNGAACDFGILDCKDIRPWFSAQLKPARPAMVLLERETGQLLSVDFAKVRAATPSDAIHEAIAAGDLNSARALLKDNDNIVSSRDVALFTPLHAAAFSGNKAAVDLLLSYRADVNAKDIFGETPLHYALVNGHDDIVELLRRNGGHDYKAEIDEASKNGDLAQIAALVHDDSSLISVRDQYGNTPLHIAISANQNRAAELLISDGADVNAKSNGGVTPLQISSVRGNGAIVQLLLSKGADVNARHDDGGTALFEAASESQDDVVKMLLDRHADVSLKGFHGWTALHEAALKGDNRIAEMLLASGADINARDDNDQVPLDFAVSSGKTKSAELLIAKGAGVNVRDSRGWTPLHLAIINGHKDIAELLRRSGGVE